MLAHNFEPTFTAVGHIAFPHAGLPMSRVAPAPPPPPPPPADPKHPEATPPDTSFSNYYPLFADLVAYVHTINWEVVEPERRARVRQRLLTMARLSREMIAAVRAERDNDHEWIPNARQASWVEDNMHVTVTNDTLDAWVRATNLAEDVLNGRKLVPFWRFAQGMDMEAFFDHPTRFDLVMLLTGQGAIPYLRDGPKVTGDELTAIGNDLGPNPLLFMFWFN